jgi:enoyl-CoA hydratase
MPTLAVRELADRLVATLRRPEAGARGAGSDGPFGLRLTTLVMDAPGGHPVADDLTRAILCESGDKRARMDPFLTGDRR